MVHWPMLWQYGWMFVFVTLCSLFPPLAEPSENFREILQNVAKSHGVSNMRKLGHLNNFIKVKPSHYNVVFFSSPPPHYLQLRQSRWNRHKDFEDGWLPAQWSVKIDWLCPPTPPRPIRSLFRYSVTVDLSLILPSRVLLPAGPTPCLSVVTLTVNVTGALGMRALSGRMRVKRSTLALKPEISVVWLLFC